jgi:UrcA family protein
MSMSRNHTLFAACAAISVLTSAVHANEPDPISRKVFVGDLDLLSTSGQATMEKRVRAAAFQVCRQSAGNRMAEVQCRRAALATAENQMAQAVNSARLRAATQMATR